MAAFNYQKWQRWSQGFDLTNTTFWNYSDTDSTFAQISTAGYFDVVNVNPNSPQITLKDLIYIVASDQEAICSVDSVTPTITVSVYNPVIGGYLRIDANLSDVADAQASFDNIAPSSPAQGNLIYYDGTHWVKLATSATAGNVLTNNGTATNPTWSAIPASGTSYGDIYPIVIGQFSN